MSNDQHLFVNRVDEINLFTQVRQDQYLRLLVLYGPQGVGKSGLLHQLRQSCQKSNLLSPLVDFRSGDLAQPTQVIQQLRVQIRGAFDQKLSLAETSIQRDLAQPALQPALASLLALAGQATGSVTISGSTVTIGGDLVGGNKLVLHNSPIVFNPSQGQGLAQEEIALRRTIAFREALAELVASQTAVFFFDHWDEAGQPVNSWLQQQLIQIYLQESHLFANLWVVLACRQSPFSSNGRSWEPRLHAEKLQPLPQPFIRQLWVERLGLDPAHLATIIPASGGDLHLLYVMARNLAAAVGVNG